jgi:hypothetical protein
MSNKKLNKALLSEELRRFKSLTNYNYYDDRNTISENFPIVAMEDNEPNEPNLILGTMEEEEDANADNLNTPEDANVDSDAEDIANDISTNTEEPNEPTGDLPDANMDAPIETPPAPIETPPAPEDDAVELDVTELVKGSEAAKQSADAANSKIEQLMNMVNKLESQLSGMSAISSKIDSLEKEIEIRNPTPKEQLEMRSLDSYPYSVKLTDFWSEKGDRYDTGSEPKKPEEYVLTQKDVNDDYSESNIKNSFDSNEYEEEDY